MNHKSEIGTNISYRKTTKTNSFLSIIAFLLLSFSTICTSSAFGATLEELDFLIDLFDTSNTTLFQSAENLTDPDLWKVVVYYNGNDDLSARILSELIASRNNGGEVSAFLNQLKQAVPDTEALNQAVSNLSQGGTLNIEYQSGYRF